ncbi:SOS response-associated peptidase [Actinomycetospora straminea]|uniref:Abasic site processing protein n=1 Tax=Actinomycetospora straminea TaxID=663607 RepID=A0ABP9F6N8_9PSEU|nr:SOS response-associated peptidase [Actinomycetospora straminea]MDD7935515.1 SOS response-associated peptidase [Actinomycetospora straminea]
MCGRYSQSKDPATLAEEFDAVDATDGAWPGPEYNVAPTTTVIGVVDRHPRDEQGRADPQRLERSLRAMRWGLVPGWADDPKIGNRMINARSDSLTSKPAFRRAVRGRRCLLPADGWYEWQRDGGAGTSGRKVPYFITLPGGKSIAFAGLWETWRPKDAAKGTPPLISTTVVTIDAAGPLTEIHHRMPLVLPAERWRAWLDPDNDDPTDLLEPPPPELLTSFELRQVSTMVNNVANHGPELIEERHDEPEQVGLDLDLDADVPATQ